MNHLVIGRGEVGSSVAQALRKYYSIVYDRDIEAIDVPEPINILHIAIPYNDRFKLSVNEYRDLYQPDLIIVYSTVPIGTCEELEAVHSPVEGRHPNIAHSILTSRRWIGTSNFILADLAASVWEPLCNIKHMDSANFTEWLKLRSTSKYGVNLVWADYEAKVSRKLGMDFADLKKFDEDYNALYLELGLPQFQRYILDDPQGHIGGHCVVPNAELLDNQYPNDMLKAIQKMKQAI